MGISFRWNAPRPRLPRWDEIQGALRGASRTLIEDPVSDAYWSFTHPIDRIMGRGRAENGQMMFPLGGRLRGPKGERYPFGDAHVAWQNEVVDKLPLIYRPHMLAKEFSHPDEMTAQYLKARATKGGKIRVEGSPMQRELNRRFEGHRNYYENARQKVDDTDELMNQYDFLNPEDISYPRRMWERWREGENELDHAIETRPGVFDYLRKTDPIIRQRGEGHIAAQLTRLSRKSPRHIKQAGKAAEIEAKGNLAFGPAFPFRTKGRADFADRRVTKRTAKEAIVDFRRAKAGLRPKSGRYQTLWRRGGV